MSVGINERIAAIATIASDGEIEIGSREPFAAIIAERVVMQTFMFEAAEITIVDLGLPVAAVPPRVDVDHWIARVAPGLFNVHLSMVEVEGTTFVEARTTLIGDTLTVETLAAALTLLAVGAATAAEQLKSLLAAPAVPDPAASQTRAPGQESDVSQSNNHSVRTPMASAGYL